MRRDFILAFRRLRASPLFAIFAVFSLALGIGATTAAYSIFAGLFAPPSGVSSIETLVDIQRQNGTSLPSLGLSYSDYVEVRARQTVFAQIAAWRPAAFSLVANGHVETARGELVNGDYFSALGVKSRLGRTLQPADDLKGAPPVAMISSTFWHQTFGGAPDVIGKVVRINGSPFEVVGVAPADFRGVFNGGFVPSSVWVPLETETAATTPWILLKARLRPGRTFTDAGLDVNRIAQRLNEIAPVPSPRGPIPRRWMIRPTSEGSLDDSTGGLASPIAASLLAAVVMALLVACTNLTNLMLARYSSRRGEFAVLLALGASRAQLIRGILAEGVTLAVPGAIIGTAMARAGLAYFQSDVQLFDGVSVHVTAQLLPSVLGITVLTTMLTLIVTSAIPAFRVTRLSLFSNLTVERSTAGSLPWRHGRLLIALQVAISVGLVSIGALWVAQLRAQTQRHLGFDLERLAVARVDFRSQRYEQARSLRIVDAVIASLTQRPGVENATAMSGFPVGWTITGYVGIDGEPTHPVGVIAGDRQLFATLGVPILYGRSFDASDQAGSPAVTVVSSRMAQTLFGQVDVVGRQVVLQQTQKLATLTIVGVSANTDVAPIGRRDLGLVYTPLAQDYQPAVMVVVRTSDDPKVILPFIKQAFASVDPALAISQQATAVEFAMPERAFFKVVATLATTLGGLTLLLVAAGLFGLLAELVSRRTREIGVRVALGAQQSDIIAMVIRDGMTPVIVGTILGLTIGMVTRTTLRGLVGQSTPFDLAALIAVSLVVIAATVVACLVPARRAATIEPSVALRDL